LRTRGFTLVELAFVLAVLGVLVSLTVPGYRAITLRSRAAEAPLGLEALADAELRYFRDHGGFVACPPMPPGAPPRGTSATLDAKAPGFKELGFHMDGPIRYQYEVVLEKSTFKAIARGDLDGNGRLSTFTLRGDTLALDVQDELE
jgi:prepilin-type N-terminal cleavage/methylation domain-containing protein